MESLRSFHPTSLPAAGAMFEAVAQQDYEGIVRLLAGEGLRSLEAVRHRWGT
jgi:hypothetical protein